MQNKKVCPLCGDSSWKTTANGELRCKTCGEIYSAPQPTTMSYAQPTRTVNNQQTSSNLYDSEMTKLKLISECKKSVCFIRVEYASGAVVTGSGWYGERNMIITNAHVIDLPSTNDMYNSIICEFPDETGLGRNNRFLMAPVYFSANEDIAILYPVDRDFPSNINVLKRSSDILLQGQTVFTIGNPLGEKFIYTEGKVNRTNVQKEGRAYGSIQTDIKIDHGNSGGAIFNMKGEVVAMSTYDEKKVEHLKLVANGQVVETPILTGKGFCFGVTIDAINAAIAVAKSRL